MRSELRRLFPFLIVAIVPFLLILLLETTASTESSDEPQENASINFDIRSDRKSDSWNRLIARAGLESLTEASMLERTESVRQAASDLKSRRSNINVEFNDLLGSAETVAPSAFGKTEMLTPASDRSRRDVLRSFLKQNPSLFAIGASDVDSLRITADYTNPDGNLSFVHLEQLIDGVRVFGGEIKAGFTKRNEIIRIVNGLAPFAPTTVSGDFGDATAIANELLAGRPGDTVTDSAKFYFPIAAGVLRPSWRFLIESEQTSEYVVVDAGTGIVLWRKNLIEHQTQAATYEVYGNDTTMMRTADSPSPGTPWCPAPTGCVQPPAIPRTQFTLVGNEAPYTFNSLGWITDGENRTFGNNAEVGIDRIAPNGIDPDGWATGNPNRSFVFAYNPAPGVPAPGNEPLPTTQTFPPSTFQQGVITHAFYLTNRFHDETYRLGFTEAARNFQGVNFGRGGTENDPIVVELQDGSGTNGANFATPADGTRPRGQMFVWTGPTPDRDGGLDSQVLTHELTHGLSNRLHGDATGLLTNMSRGMGEGWSDFYALALLSEATDAECGTNAVAGYITYQIFPGFEANYYYGIRRFPTARRQCIGPNGRPHNPITFRYLNSDCNTLLGTTTSNPPPSSAFPRGPIGTTVCDQVHNIGEIWSSALWDVRGELIEIHGAAEGNRRALQYITDGMKLSPANPTLLQSRDAIIAAAAASSAADVWPVRRGFAIRGMGTDSSIVNTGSGSNNTVVIEGFNVHPRAVRSDFDGDGQSDLSVFRPSDGVWYQFRSAEGFTAVNWGMSGDTITPGDFDGDRRTDLAVFRPTSDSSMPDFYVLRSSSNTFSALSWGIPGDLPAIGDYDGDSRDDFSIFRPSNHTFYVLLSASAGALVFSNIPSGVPTPGDYDGDGRADFATYSVNSWYRAGSIQNYSNVSVTQFGTSGDLPVQGDYDGDGRTDLAVFRPSDRNWYIRATGGSTPIVNFGLSSDIPVPADYDGDGRLDIAVYRNGTWYAIKSSGGIGINQFGLSADIPVPRGYLP